MSSKRVFLCEVTPPKYGTEVPHKEVFLDWTTAESFVGRLLQIMEEEEITFRFRSKWMDMSEFFKEEN